MQYFLKLLLVSFTWLPNTTPKTLRADLIAGLTGAVIVLPQGVAYAAIAGLPPEYGLYTAMVTPVFAAMFGSSMHLISGPTAAISIVVFSGVSQYAEVGSPDYTSMALTMTFLAGVYQAAFALARLGTLVNFISHTVVIGFTAGAAVLIATSQMKYMLGVEVERGSSFLHVWIELFEKIGDTQWMVLVVGIATLLSSLITKKILPKWPNLLVGMVVGGLVAYWFSQGGNLIPLVGEIPRHLPPLSLPDFSTETITRLAPQAFAIALLGLIEAVSISRAVATKSQQRIDGNQEFFGQGLSNIFGSFFSSYAGSGSFTRSGVNYDSGAQTPMSAVFAAVFLALIVLLIAPITAYLPVAAMGGAILLVSYNLIDQKAIKTAFKHSRTETSVFLTTFFATLFLELEFAIYLGVILSLVLFLAKTAAPGIVFLSPKPDETHNELKNSVKYNIPECPQLKIIRVDMSIYFGSVNAIQDKLHDITESTGIKHIMIVGSAINSIDLSGMEMLATESERLKKLGGGLYLTGLKTSVCKSIQRGHFLEHFGRENIFEDKHLAIEEITQRILDHDICSKCDKRVFQQCATLPKP